MGISKNSAVAIQLRTLFNFGSIRELTDGQLLERFATESSEASELAFAVLVERHGPMVLRVCRSVLSSPHDSEDAFQATFLVLGQEGTWALDTRFARAMASSSRLSNRLAARLAAARRRRHELRVNRAEIRGTYCDIRRHQSSASRRDSQASRAISSAGRSLRSRGTHTRAGGPAPGLSCRHRQKPASAGSRTSPRASFAAVASLRRVPCSPARPFSCPSGPKSAPTPSSLPRREPPFQSAVRRTAVQTSTLALCTGGQSNHVVLALVQARAGSC